MGGSASRYRDMKIRQNASSLHKKTLFALREYFLPVEIRQEYKVRNEENGRWLWFDFFLPSYGIAIEVQGEQHFKYNDHFYGGKTDFIMQQRRDDIKEVWCSKNGIHLIKVNYDEDITPELLWKKIESCLK